MEISLGAVPDWLAAIFTGATVYFLWRQSRPPEPTAEVVRKVSDQGEFFLVVLVRNPAQSGTIFVGSAHTIPGWTAFCTSHTNDWPIEPGESQSFDFRLKRDGGQGLADTLNSTPTMSLTIRSNQRTRKYKLTI